MIGEDQLISEPCTVTPNLTHLFPQQKGNDMGIEGIENLTDGDGEALDNSAPQATRPTDQEIKDRQDAELAEARDEHNKRTGGGSYAKK